MKRSRNEEDDEVKEEDIVVGKDDVKTQRRI